uniref:HEAT repeat domain-containing protein n=1 Tax=candidate division WOR-3 bacterium TaxID=2052148 RepID=A0A7C2PJS7_UNCW3
MHKEDKNRRQLTEQEVEQLLKSNNLLERFKAVELLKESKNLDRLLSLIYSESWHLREKVQEALSQFTLAELKDKLLPLLDEKIWYVRAATINIIGNLVVKELEIKGPDMERTLQNEERFEETKMPKEYEKIGEIFDLILPHLSEKNEVVRANTARAIARILTFVPFFKTKLSGEQSVIIENQLRELKEFDLLHKILNL